MYVFVFGTYFGLAVAKVLHHKEIESTKENSHYHSDLFAMIGKNESTINDCIGIMYHFDTCKNT